MLGGIFIFFLGAVISFLVIQRLKKRYPYLNSSLLNGLYYYHYFLSLCYYLYVLFNPSDSKYYYQKVEVLYRGDTWSDFYGTSTRFIEWLAFPFVHYLNFSYEAMMALFSLAGFLGFLYFYVFFRENIKLKHTFLGMDLLTLIFFLPNLHFWSSSLGKGSVSMLGLGLFFYGMSKIRTRWLAIIIGGIIVYHVRPHILLVILVSSVLAFVFTNKGVGFVSKVAFVLGASIAFFFIYQDVLQLVGIEEEQFVSQGLDLTHRASELTKATSGVDITHYNLAMQLFTFLYRPLFFDAPGLLGLFVSFENMLYLLLTIQLFSSFRGITYLFRSSFLVKSALLSFISVAIALAQIAGNLGLAMRQKSQVMILFLFVIISFLDEQKIVRLRFLQRRKQLKARMQEIAGSTTYPA
jgi:hypothetical protein